MPEGCTQPSKPGSGEELKIDLGWQEGLSQRFHRLSQTALDKLIASLLAVKYQRGKQAPLDASSSVIQRLCSASRRRFLQEPSLINVPAGTVVVGDLHGDYKTLMRIFKDYGHPPQQRYLFLGDFVDRGVNGLHIVLLLFAYKLRYPDHVFLIRGNHESAPVTLLYGFYAECVTKSSEQTWQRVINVFDCLPIAALVAKDVFCVHGGLSPQLNRPEDVNTIKRPCKILGERNDLLSDLTWSDPHQKIKGWQPNPRGAGYFFGLDEARRFKEANGVRMIVRSHELMHAGWSIAGKKDVITIFSSLDYRNTGNDAAVLMVTEDGKCSIKILRSEEDPDTCLPGQPVSSTPSQDSESWGQPRSTRLSECSDQSSLTSRSANASLDCTGPAAALRPSQSTESVGPAAALEPRESAEGDALAPLPSAALPVVGPTVKKAPRTSTELYAFALAAPRLDAPPLGIVEEPAWRDSLHLKSESSQSADVKLAIKLAARQVGRQPKAGAGARPVRASFDRAGLGGTRRGSMYRLDSDRTDSLSRAASSEDSASIAASNRASLDDALRRSKSATGPNIYAELAAAAALAQTVQ